MKIRFYHMWSLHIYFWVWSPLLIHQPDLVRAQLEYLKKWLGEHPEDKPDKTTLRVVK